MKENRILLNKIVNIEKRPMGFTLNNLSLKPIPVKDSLNGKKRMK